MTITNPSYSCYEIPLRTSAMKLSVSRESEHLESGNSTVFFDEKLIIKVSTKSVSSLHLFVCVNGKLNTSAANPTQTSTICDTNLEYNTEWVQEVHIRHPRSPLKRPILEIVATSKPQPKLAESEEPVVFKPFEVVEKQDFVNPKYIKKTHAKSESTVSAITVHDILSQEMGLDNPPPPPEPQTDAEVCRWHADLVQALEMEVRSVRPALERDRVIAELNLVCGVHPVNVVDLNVKFDFGVAKVMGQSQFPMTLMRYDNYALCYNLQLRTAPASSNFLASRKPLNIYLECEVESQSSKPHIHTLWTPIIDFESTQGPFPKTPALSIPINSPAPMKVSSVNPNSLVPNSNNLSLMGGVSITITGPQFVNVGDTFTWDVKVVNKSQRSRLFTLVLNNSINDVISNDSSVPSFSYNPDILRMRALQNSRKTGATVGIIPLVNELRIGTLQAYSCFETRIELLALKPGTHSIESSKIEDLNTRDSYDAGGLLEVIVK